MRIANERNRTCLGKENKTCGDGFQEITQDPSLGHVFIFVSWAFIGCSFGILNIIILHARINT